MSKAVLPTLRRHFSQATLPPLQLTTLPNKIRVATESTPGHFSAIGLYIDAGSRYEDPSSSGASHFLDRMAFKVGPFALPRRPALHPCAFRVLGRARQRTWLRQWTD